VYDPEFTPADDAALAGPWGWLGSIAARALEGGRGGLIEDDLAYVRPWGCDPSDVVAPVLLLHGERDRVIPSSHSRWLSSRCRAAELRLSPEDGHISILATAGEAALRWLRERAG